MVPSIMQVSSEEKPIFTPPTWNCIMDMATVRNTKPMDRERRLLREWKKRSKNVSSAPISEPSSSEPTISRAGSRAMDTRLTSPEIRARAMPKDTAKITRPTASSRATMGKSRSVSLPLALYWRTTISVAAGAVAEAMAPSVSAAGRGILSGMARCTAISAASTRMVAITAWMMPMTVACLPVSLSWERRNSLPMAKAMKPSATSERSSKLFTWSSVWKPRPSMFRRPSRNGPMTMPLTR